MRHHGLSINAAAFVALATLLSAQGANPPTAVEARASLALRNLTTFDAKDLRLEVTTTAPWLTVEAPETLADLPAGGEDTVQIGLVFGPNATWGDEAAVEWTLTLRFAGEADRTFRMRHLVDAPSPGERKPTDLQVAFEWLLVQGRPDTYDNRVELTVKNGGKATIHGFTLHLGTTSPMVRPGVAIVTEPEGEANPGIPAGGSRVFAVPYVVDDRAIPGSSGVISVRGRASTRTVPRLYQAAILVAVDAAAPGGRGNFEGIACFNLPPAEGEKPSADSADWDYVPRGTQVVISQVYPLRGPRGLEKQVEQFVGYGHVLDERGYFRLQIDPVGRPPWRLRLVVETMAHEMRKLPDGRGGDRFVAGRARAAVTPFGKRTYRVISRVFRAVKESQVAGGSGGSKEMIVPLPNQVRSNFVDGRKILLPYYGYAQALEPDRDAGIAIEWEGELSTGGNINFWGSGETVMSFWGGQMGGYGYAEMLQEATDLPGLIWHNRPELVQVLSHVVRAQDRLRAILPVPEAGEEGEAEAQRIEIPPAIAQWKPHLKLTPGETGYWLQDDGLWRLMVSGDRKDPDEGDADLVLRGYGAAVRRYLLEDGARGAKPLKPAERRYAYDRSTTAEQAFAFGFDTFFACAVLGRPHLRNEHASDEGVRVERSIDLAKLIADLREAKRSGGDEALLGAELMKKRGVTSPAAVAAALWLAYDELGDGFLRDLLAPRESEEDPAGMARFLEIVSARAPSLFGDLATLGLMPRAEQVPSAVVAAEAIPPEDVTIIYDGRGLGREGEVKAFLELSVNGRSSLVPIPLAKHGATGVVSPATWVEGGKGGDAKGFEFRPGQRVSWRVVTKLGDGRPLPGPTGSFIPSVAGDAMDERGGRIAFRDLGGRPAAFSVDAGALEGSKKVSVNPLRAPTSAGGKQVLGGTFFRINGTRYLKPARLRLPYDPSEFPEGSPPPTIHRLNDETGEWENLGGREIRPGLIEAEVDHTSLFALLLDPDPPRASMPRDGPDPFDPGGKEPWQVSFRLSGSSEVTLEITDGEGRVVARPVGARAFEAGEVACTWDGRDATGQPLRDGTYGYVLRTRDAAGRVGDPGSGRLRIHRGFTGGVRGSVEATGTTPDVFPTVSSVHGSAITAVDADGSFAFFAIAPGAETLRFAARGHFSEERTVAVKAFETADLPQVLLTDRSLTKLQIDPAIIHPDAEPSEPPLPERAGILMAFDRSCEARVELLDRRDRVVRTFFEGRAGVGALGLEIDGSDERGRPLSGVFRVRVIARVGGVEVVQGEERILIDRGLVSYARAIPRIFSPDGDGLDDVTRFTFRLADLATVTAVIEDASGAPVKTLLQDAALQDGWHEYPWDGTDDEGNRLPEARYHFVVRATYQTGEVSRPLHGDVVLDSAPPRFLEIEPQNAMVIPTGLPTIRARLARAADLDPQSLRVKIDELTVRPDRYDPATGWMSYTPKSSLGEGVHIVLVYARDLAGNMAQPEATSFEVKLASPDRTKPTATFLLPGEGAKVYDPSPSIEAELRDALSGVDPQSIRLSVDGDAVPNRVRRFIPGRTGKSWDMWWYEVAIILFDPLEGRLRYNLLQELPTGKHVIRLTASDRLGNRLRPIEQTFTVIADQIAPEVVIEKPTRSWRGYHDTVNLVARISDEGGSGLDPRSLRLLLDGNELPTPELDSGQIQTSFEAGAGASHLLSLEARDRAGKRGVFTTVFSIHSDETPPGLSCDLPPHGLPANSPSTLKILAWDHGSGLDPATIEATLDGRALAMSSPSADSYELALPALAPGRHQLVFAVTDRSGNTATLPRPLDVRRSTTPPTIRIESPSTEVAAAKEIPVRIILESLTSKVDAKTLEFRLDGVRLPLPPKAFDPDTNTLRFFLPQPFDAGSQHVLTVDVADEDGNLATQALELLAR